MPNNTWIQTFDFRLSAYSAYFTPHVTAGVTLGNWVLGSGWQGVFFSSTGHSAAQLDMFGFSPTTLTQISVVYTASGTGGGDENIDFLSDSILHNITDGTLVTDSATVSASISPPIWGIAGLNSGLSGSVILVKLILYGTGANPFLQDDGAECPCNYVGKDLEEARDWA